MNSSKKPSTFGAARSALQQTRKDLEDLKYALDASAIVAVTDGQGRITYANQRFCDISGYTRDELIGQDHRIINSGYHSEAFFQDLWSTIAAGRVWEGEIRNKTKSGEIYWVDTTIVPFLDSERKPYQYISIRYEITQRKRLEETLKSLPNRIIQAQESEREWISREIHDDLGQSLATLKILLQSARDSLPAAEQNSLGKPLTYLNTVIEKARKLAAGLRPSTLELLGLSRAIRSLVEDVQHQQKLEVNLKMDDLDRLAFAGPEVHLYRIVQEALTNVIRHARAQKVELTLALTPRCLMVTIADDGQGFAGEVAAVAATGGLGLTSMRERAKLLEGDIYIETSRGGGTTLTLTVPVTAKEE